MPSYAPGAQIFRRFVLAQQPTCTIKSGATSVYSAIRFPTSFKSEQLGLATSLGTGRLSSIRNDALEVTLQIVPGESGGPIFLIDTGKIIGLADSRFDDERSIGFAVPLGDVLHFLHKIDRDHGF